MEITRKIPISFNDSEFQLLRDIGIKFGFGSQDSNYGAIPKTVKISIKLVDHYAKFIEQFIPDIKDDELDRLFSYIKEIKHNKNNSNLKQQGQFLTQ